MAGGIKRSGKKVAGSINDLKDAFEETFTEAVVSQITSSADQLKKTLKDVDDKGLVNALSSFCERIDQKTIDNLNESSKALFKALKNVDEQNTIEEFSKSLKTLNSISDWVAQNEKLMQLAKYSLYAGMAYAVLSPIISALQGVSTAKGEAAFRDQVLQKLNILTAHSMQQSRLQAGMVLQLNKLLDGKDLGDDKDKFKNLASEAQQVLDHTPTVDARILKNLTNRFINAFYIDLGMDLLNGATVKLPTRTAIDAIVWNKMELWPAHDATQLTYASVLQEYESDKINELMDDIVGLFAQHGGNDFYHKELIFEYTYREKRFGDFIQDFVKHHQTPQNVRLCQYGQRMDAVWGLATTKINDAFEQAPPADVVTVIIHRALLEYCRETSAYFRAPFNLKSELQNGVYHGLSNLFHPVDSLSTMTKNLSLSGTTKEQRDSRKKMKERIQGHPLGFGVESATTASPALLGAWYLGYYTAAGVAGAAKNAAAPAVMAAAIVSTQESSSEKNNPKP